MRIVLCSRYLEDIEASMSKIATIRVSEHVARRLRAIARERGDVDEVELADDAIMNQLDIDDAWAEEIQRRLEKPEDQKRYISHADGRAWLQSLGTENELPRPEGKPLSDILHGNPMER